MLRGEGRDDHPAVERLHDLAERLAHDPLRGRVARVLGPRRVGQERDHALLAEPREDVEVAQLAVDRGVVELEVAGVDDGPDRGPERDAHRVRDRVADPERDDRERADRQLVARLEREQRVVVELVLLDLVAQQAARERARVDGDARELGQDVRQAADVVLVGVGDEERPDLVAVLLEVRHVGHDEVDAEHLLVGEHQAAVDDDDVVAVLEHVHVLADLPHPAERDDAERHVGIRHGCGVHVARLVAGQKRVSWEASSGAGSAATAAGIGAGAGGGHRGSGLRRGGG